jgi:hypothetical protein
MFTESGLKIHRYNGSVRITDLTNAGRRGKKVMELTVLESNLTPGLDDRVLKQAVSSVMHMDYSGAKARLEAIADKHPGLFTLHEQALRAIDVEPMGTPVELEKKFPDGSILRLKSSPNDFQVRSSKPINAPNKPAHGLMQDTSYWPRSKKDGQLFYAWIKQNMSKAGNMNILEIIQVWDSLGVTYESH